MMAKRPEDRYQTPAAVAETLTPFALAPFGSGDTPVGDPTSASVMAPRPQPKTLKVGPLGHLPGWWWMPITGAIAALLVVATILIVRSKPGNGIDEVVVRPPVEPKPILKPEQRQGVPPVADLPPKVKVVVERLADRDPKARREAARTLRKLGDKSAVQALMKRVADDTWGQTWVLSPQRPSGDTPYENVATGRNQGSKYAALEALGGLAPDQVSEALTQASKSKNPQVRSWAVKQMAAPQDNKPGRSGN
jgi:hypothetical protein